MDDSEETWLAPGAAAALAHVTLQALRNMETRGLLTCVRTPGNQRRYRLSDIQRLMATTNPELEAS